MTVTSYGVGVNGEFLTWEHEDQGERRDYVRLSGILYVQLWLPGESWTAKPTVNLTLTSQEIIHVEFPNEESAADFAHIARGGTSCYTESPLNLGKRGAK